MSRAERVCKTLAPWMLRLILTMPVFKKWWAAAWLELFQREVVEAVAAEVDEESGPWACVMPPGMH